MNKKLLCILVTLVLMLSACATVDIKLSLLPDNTVVQTIDVYVDGAKMEATDASYARQSIDKLSAHFTNNGYMTTLNTNSDRWHLNAELKKGHSTAAAAAAAFQGLLSSDNGIFDVYDFKYNIAPQESAYYFIGSVDVSKLFSEEEMNKLPSDLGERIQTFVASPVGNLVVQLPASSVNSSQNEYVLEENTVTISVPLTFENPGSVGLSTIVNGEPPNIGATSLTDRIESTEETISLMTAIALGCAVLSVIFGVMFIIVKKRQKKERVNE